MVRFAPELRVTKNAGTKIEELLQSSDVIISSPAQQLPPKGVPLHRLIIDESHLLDLKDSGWDTGTLWTRLREVRATNMWMVTGTPITNQGCHKQASLLGHAWPTAGLALRCERERFSTELAAELRKVMVRHTKSQRIAGEAALALPEADCKTELVTMSDDERLLYSLARCVDGIPEWLAPDYPHGSADSRANSATALAAGFSRQHAACRGSHTNPRSALPAHMQRFDEACAAYDRLYPGGEPDLKRHSKYARLLREVTEMVAHDASARLVVLTASDEVQARIARLLRDGAAGLHVLEPGGKGVLAEQRRRIFRAFQQTGAEGGAQAIVSTFKTTAVGITLTAASRVYLFEPTLDPATELQAAGRIHRLGQTKQVLICRYAYADTVEQAIVDLHAEMLKGTVKPAELKVAAAGKQPLAEVPAAAKECFKRLGCHTPHVPGGPTFTETVGPYNSRWKVSKQRCTECNCSVDLPGAELLQHVCNRWKRVPQVLREDAVGGRRRCDARQAADVLGLPQQALRRRRQDHHQGCSAER